jgi:hypothetical protein
MERYYQRFITLNDVSNRNNRVRYKDYAIDKVDLTKDIKVEALTDAQLEEASLLNPETNLFSTDYIGNTLYDAEDLKMSTAKSLVEGNKDIVFLYNGATESQSNASRFDFTIHGTSTTSGNTFALPTRKNYTGSNNALSDIPTEAGINVIDPKNKEMIDNAIASLIELKNQGVNIAFNKAGYGQYMIGGDDATGALVDVGKAKAPKTFLYLSEQLFRNFGFKNPNYADTGSGRKTIQSTQEVSDDMVRDMLNHCFNF